MSDAKWLDNFARAFRAAIAPRAQADAPAPLPADAPPDVIGIIERKVARELEPLAKRLDASAPARDALVDTGQMVAFLRRLADDKDESAKEAPRMIAVILTTEAANLREAAAALAQRDDDARANEVARTDRAFIAAANPAAIIELLDRLAAAERERDELIHDIERQVAIAAREAEARIAAERERDEAYAKSVALLEMTNSELRLLAGELSNDEVRAIQAVLKSRQRAIRALSPQTKQQSTTDDQD
jgi:hypothetical protein